MRNIFYQVIEQQIKTVILSKVTDQYALRIIDSAVTPEQAYRPNALFVLVAFGGISSSLGAYFISLVSIQKLTNAWNRTFRLKLLQDN